MAGSALLPDTDGRLVDNMVHFTRALRKAGVRVGPAQVEDAVRAVAAAGFGHRTDFYHTLRATLITRAEHLEVFHQVFTMFWRDPEYLEKMMHTLSPILQGAGEAPPPPKAAASRRAADALGADAAPPPQRASQDREELEISALHTFSANEILRNMDFEQMSAAEMAEATRALRDLHLPVRPLRTRRLAPHPAGRRPDVHATLRQTLRRSGEIERLALARPRTRPPRLVAFCDISGSMSVYSRMLLRFLHALAQTPHGDWGRVSAFTFGTRLTNITRSLQKKDPDEALAAVGRDAVDWQGGTRIGAALERFNKDWSRRGLGQGAVVLLVTDGLERGDTEALSQQAERLQLSCRTLLWLNPLLRFEGFEPKAGGIRALMPHVDGFHACHSLDSLAQAGAALSAACAGARAGGMRPWS